MMKYFSRRGVSIKNFVNMQNCLLKNTDFILSLYITITRGRGTILNDS